MNKFFNHLLFNVVTLSLFASITTQCMLIKNFKKIPQQQKLFVSTINNIQKINTQKDDWYKGVIEGTKNAMRHTDPTVKLEAFSLLEALGKGNKAIKEAMEIIIVQSQCADESIRVASLKLLRTIVRTIIETDNQVLITDTIDIVKKNIKDKDMWGNNIATDILLYLIKEHQELALEIAQDLANTCMESGFSSVRENGLKIYSALLHKDLAKIEAMAFVHRSFRPVTLNITPEVLQLLKILYDKDHSLVKWAVEYASIGCATMRPHIYQEAMAIRGSIFTMIEQSRETKS